MTGGSFSATHQYLDDNPTGTPSDVYNISVVLTDDDTGTDTDATTTTISNVAPTITSFTGPTTNVVQGQLLSYSATFSDVGTLDTHTAVFNWGDATSSPGVVTEAGGSGSVSGSHIYTSAGTYTITLTVTDDDTGAVSSTKQVVVSVVAIGEGCCETNALLIGGGKLAENCVETP